MTRWIKPYAVVLMLGLMTVSTIAAAHGPRRHHYHHGPRVSLGVAIGAPLWYPGPVYHSYPYRPRYYYPYAVPVPQAAPVYIEREDTAALVREPREQYWYYCRESETYYPYVSQCAGPWQRVPARPPEP